MTASTVYDAAFAAIELGLSDLVAVEVLAALADQDYAPDGTLVDVMTVTWRLAEYPGTFAVQVPMEVDWTAGAIAAILYQAKVVEGIYAGLASLADVFPGGLIGPGPLPIPPPGGGVAV